MKLLNLDHNAKTVKGQEKGFKTAILYLAPSDLSSQNLCPYASKGCRAVCLNTAGHGAFQNVQQARLKKSEYFNTDRTRFMNQLVDELGKFTIKAERDGFTPVVRLNGTSDIIWERIPVAGEPSIMDVFSTVQFYDYTKIPIRYRKNRPANYHLTFSLSENNDAHAIEALEHGVNVAVVFDTNLPKSFMSRPVIDGDVDDLRFEVNNEYNGVVVGLRAKGKARKDTSGFVRLA